MDDIETEIDRSRASSGIDNQRIVDRLVFAAIREQTRARRWRIFFMMFFVVYISLISVIFIGGDSGVFGNGVFGSGDDEDGGSHTALIKMSGIIASGENAGSETIIGGLQAAFEDDNTVLVVLEINSPGGSPVQSAYIFDEIMRLKQLYETIPIYAVVTDIAASGGYFVAAAADRIYVNKSSLVGSIGVRMDSFGFVELMQKVGIERRLLVAGKNKALFDPFLPEQNTQKAHLQIMLDEVHQHFISAVKQGRGDRLVEDEELFNGLVWSGEKALALGLVDAYGTTRSVARELDAENIVDFTPRQDLFERLASRIGSSIGAQISQYLQGSYSIN